MLRKFLFKYNNIDFQDLKTAYELSYTSWNNIINQLREQTNNNTTYIETLNTWLFGSPDTPYDYAEDFGNFTNFYDYIQEFVQKVQSSIKDLKATKLNSVSYPTIVYATNSAGTSTSIPYSESSIAKAIVKRDDSGRIEVAVSPTAGYHAANKLYVDKEIKQAKLDIFNDLTGNSNKTFVERLTKPNVIYATNSLIGDVGIPYSSDLIPNSIVQRDQDGHIEVGVPKNENSAVNKKYVEEHYITQDDIGKAGGVAPLDQDGKILSTHLPSYVDDIIEGIYKDNEFYIPNTSVSLITNNEPISILSIKEESTSPSILSIKEEDNQIDTNTYIKIIPEKGKIYLDTNTNISYRWSGSIFIEVSSKTEILDIKANYIPRRLSNFTDAVGDTFTQYLYVDNNGSDAKISITDLNALLLKTVETVSADNTPIGSYIFLKKGNK